MPKSSGTIALETPQLIGILGEHEKKISNRGRKKRVELIGEDIFRYGKDIEVKMLKNNNYFILSQFLYRNCRRVGESISVEKPYYLARSKQKYDHNNPNHRTFVHDAVGSANRWARGKGMPNILSFRDGKLFRLGTENSQVLAEG